MAEKQDHSDNMTKTQINQLNIAFYPILTGYVIADELPCRTAAGRNSGFTHSNGKLLIFWYLETKKKIYFVGKVASKRKEKHWKPEL